MFWTVLHITEIILWFIMAGSVAYVVFFAIISLFYEKDDFASTHANMLSQYKERRFLILYPAGALTQGPFLPHRRGWSWTEGKGLRIPLQR